MTQIITDLSTERVGRKINGSTKNYADPKARAAINKIADGHAFVTCATGGSTAAKVVSVTDFTLKTNSPITVLFTYAFTTADPTLNVSSTGAKPIKYFGINVPVGKIKNNTLVTLVYDGTNWNITGIEYPGDVLAGNMVDLGLPSGVLWAKKNIDLTQADHFAASEFQYECTFFSWGNKEGYNPKDTSSFDYDWGSNNEGPYASTMGSKLTGNIPLSQDTARAALGAPYRMPTTEEFLELINNCDFIDANGDVIGSGTTNKLVTVNGIVGIYLQSKHNGNRIFFPCSGYGNSTSWYGRGTSGNYWSGSLHSQTYGRNLHFYSGGVSPQNNNSRFNGFAVRAVQ